jgi:NAD(P)-dependent dehydrogenase (short-subunit alcohol dehydrogenase family)
MTSDSYKPLAGRIALVTGASRGIGEAVALGLAKAGAHVIATARTQGALEALDDAILTATGEHATLVPLDLREPDGLDHLGAAIHQRWGKLDILVGAAGPAGPPHPGKPSGAQGLGHDPVDQPDGQLAPDPRHGPAAARFGRRSGAVLHQQRGKDPARVLGGLCGDQGGAGDHRRRLC